MIRVRVVVPDPDLPGKWRSEVDTKLAALPCIGATFEVSRRLTTCYRALHVHVGGKRDSTTVYAREVSPLEPPTIASHELARQEGCEHLTGEAADPEGAWTT